MDVTFNLLKANAYKCVIPFCSIIIDPICFVCLDEAYLEDILIEKILGLIKIVIN